MSEFGFADERVNIPESFLIVVDDVGVWRPNTLRYEVKVPPEHENILNRWSHMDDFRSLVEMGKALGMRILCGFTIGEWDRDNILAGLPHSSWMGRNWDNSAVLKNARELDEAAEYLVSNQEYIEFAVHGLNHMYWDDEGNCKFAEYYHNENGVRVMTAPDVMRAHLDAWFEIYRRNGFKQPIRTLIPPCFNYNYSDSDRELSYILKDYGIRYVSTPFGSLGYDTPEKPVMACVENGILTTDRTRDLTPWSEMDARVPEQYKSSYYGTHWPHFFAADPKDNMRTAERWIAYFRGYRNRFDVIPAKDHAMGSAQCFYKRFTAVNPISNGHWMLDFSEADAQKLPRESVGNSIYLHAKRPVRLKTFTAGCTIEIYDLADEFITYKLTRPADVGSVEIGIAD